MGSVELAKAYLFLKTYGKPCDITTLRNRLNTDFRYGALVEDRRLKVVNGTDISAGKRSSSTHPTGLSPLLDHMFQYLQSLHQAASIKKQIEWPPTLKDMKHFIPASSSREIVLADCVYYKYASMGKNDGNLNWNKKKVKALIEKLRTQGRGNNSEARLDEQSEEQQPQDKSNVNSMMPFDGTKYRYVVDHGMLEEILASDPVFRGESASPTTLDVMQTSSAIELVQVATDKSIYVFDCRSLGVERLRNELKGLLTSTTMLKVVHDLYRIAPSLKMYLDIEPTCVLDSQLFAEHHMFSYASSEVSTGMGHHEMSVDDLLKLVDVQMESGASSPKDRLLLDSLLSKRPLSPVLIDDAAMSVFTLLKAVPEILAFSQEELSLLKRASAGRLEALLSNGGRRQICFDFEEGFVMSSFEYLTLVKPNLKFGTKLIVGSEIGEILDLLPDHFTRKLVKQDPSKLDDANNETKFPLDLTQLSDIVMDIGREPQCWINGERMFLCEDETTVVQESELEQIIGQLGEIGDDNRAGLDGTLHRFSAIRARGGKISGLTIRVGRYITGNAELIADLLLGSDKSILFLGEPGSGKTTIVREATRILADRKNVIVVDTSNEIGGDGMIPHKCIGLARRMMVPSLELQSRVMIECVQNHTPDVQVIDEIGRPKEVEAARTVKQRGVRIIASAHGDLSKLIKNKELRGLIGGLEQVTLGDSLAKEEAKRKQKLREKDGEIVGDAGGVRKTKAQRSSDPTFDVIVELRKGEYNDWRVVEDVAKAVDSILDGRAYQAEVRSRDPESGAMFLEHVKVRNEIVQIQ